MNFAEMKRAIVLLGPGEQDRLHAFLTLLRHARRTDYRQILARRLDDPDPDQWIALSDLRADLPPAPRPN